MIGNVLVDQLDRMTEALADAPVIVEGSSGQPRPHPLLDECRKTSESLSRVVGALRLPTGEAPKSASDTNRANAAARWAKTGTRS